MNLKASIITVTFGFFIDPKLIRCNKNLKHYYLKRMNQKRCTRWPQLGDPTLYLDVTITRARYLYQMKDIERYCEEYAMGLVDNEDEVSIDKILLDGKGEVTLIEGDPGSGKTTLTLQICKRWAEGELLAKQVLIMIPLRCYELATGTNDLFDVFEKLGCPVPGMKEYAQQNNGEGLVLILDGWDELPNQLQIESLFSDIVFSKNSMFFYSTIIVTSRPSCSEKIAKVAQQRNAHYQILGFSPHNSELYIKHYFNNDLQSAEVLIAMLKGREYLRRHFYIPITVAIMCFVYSHSDKGEIPETLSKIYEHFALLYIYSNVPDTCRKNIKEFNTLSDVPEILKPLFGKLCKTAYDMLRDQKLVFDEDILGITNSDLKTLDLDPEQFDGLGLLHVEYFPTKWATTKRSYSFIHKAIQELLAAIFLLDTGNISDTLDEHFYEDSYLMNVFPFLFGLMSKELLKPLAGNLIQIFNKPDRSSLSVDQIFSFILYCMFEAHDETLCREFGQVFSEKKDFKPYLDTLLECHYACYFITVCGVKRLNVTLYCKVTLATPGDHYCAIAAKYLQNTSTDIASLYISIVRPLSHEGMEQFAKTVSTQCNILSVELNAVLDPGATAILCDSICKHNLYITELKLWQFPDGYLNENDLESIGSLLNTCEYLENLFLSYSLSEEVCLKLFSSFYKGLCETKSLQQLQLSRWWLSQDNSEVFGNIISKNCSLKELHIAVATADCLDPILNGLSSNTSIATLAIWPWPSKRSISSTSGQLLKKCFTLNRSLNNIDFTDYDPVCLPHFDLARPPLHVLWSSMQVCSICTGLCANTTVVTLDISGCYIDTEACHAVCGMFSQNTTLQHLLLNPVHLEKQEAITMIENCRDNDTLKLLSLVQWPPKLISNGKDPFKYSYDEEITHTLQEIHKLRQNKDKPLLNVSWLATLNCINALFSILYCIGSLMNIQKLRVGYCIKYNYTKLITAMLATV